MSVTERDANGAVWAGAPGGSSGTSDAPAAPARPNLRRADWRFLLPARSGADAFEHLVLLGGPAGLAERLLDAGVARRVTCELPNEHHCADAVAVLHDAGVPPARAAQALRTGGALYAEVDRRRRLGVAMTPARLQQSLRAAGLTVTGVYWATPSFDACRRYVPLDAPGSVRWYFGTLFKATTPLRLALERGVRALTRLEGRRLAPFVPYFAVTAVAADRPAPAWVLADARLPVGAEREAIRACMLTSGQDDGSRVVVLPFAGREAAPRCVLKVARLPGFAGHTAREQSTLADLRLRLDPALRRSIPEPLGVVRGSMVDIAVESFAHGQTLAASSGRWGAPLATRLSDFALGARWLTEFHRQGATAARWDAEASRRWVEQPLDAYATRFGLTPAETRLFAAARGRARELAGASVPIVPQHNDLGPWNVHRAGNEITVIDWELGEERRGGRDGLPLCDLVYLATHWNEAAHHLSGAAGRRRGFEALFVAPERGGAVAARVQEAMRRYAEVLDLPAGIAPLLLVCTWVDRAIDRVERDRSLDRRPDDARAESRHVEYVGVLADHADRLFGPAEGDA